MKKYKELYLLTLVNLILIIISLTLWSTKAKSEYKKGQDNIKTEACRLGFARYKNDKFIWQTNVFENFSKAIDSCVKNEEQTRKVATVSMEALKMTVNIAETIRQLETNKNSK